MTDIKPNIVQTIETPGSNGLFDVLSEIDVAESIIDKGPEDEIEEAEGEAPKEEILEKEGGKEEPVLDNKKQVEAEVQVKKVTASKGDDLIEVPEDATFKVKVDGKEVEVTLADLTRNYQGKVPWEKHYADTKQKEKALEVREAELNGRESAQEAKFKEAFETFKKNPYLGFEKMAIAIGEDPTDMLPIYIAQSKKTLEELAQLSEAEYRALVISKKNEYSQHKLSEREKKLEAEKTEAQKLREVNEANAYFQTKVNELGITQAEVDIASKIIQESGQDLSQKAPKELADLLVMYIEEVERPYARIEEVAREIDPNLLSNRQLIGEMKNLIKKDFTKDDIREILLEFTKDSKPKPQPQAAAQQGNPSNGTKPKSPVQGATNGRSHRAEEEPRQRVNGAEDVGPLSYLDILRDYE